MEVTEIDSCIYILPVRFPLYRSANDTGGNQTCSRGILFSCIKRALLYSPGTGQKLESVTHRLHTDHRQLEHAYYRSFALDQCQQRSLF